MYICSIQQYYTHDIYLWGGVCPSTWVQSAYSTVPVDRVETCVSTHSYDFGLWLKDIPPFNYNVLFICGQLRNKQFTVFI